MRNIENILWDALQQMTLKWDYTVESQNVYVFTVANSNKRIKVEFDLQEGVVGQVLEWSGVSRRGMETFMDIVMQHFEGPNLQ